MWRARASGAEEGAEVSPLSHASKNSFSFRVFSSFTSRTSFSAITSFGEEEDGEESKEEEEAPEGSVLGYRAAIIASHAGVRPGDGGAAHPDPSPTPGLENGWVVPRAASERGPWALKGVTSSGSQHSPSTDSPRLVAALARPRGQRPLPSRLRPGREGPRRSGDDRVAGARAAAERGAVPGAAGGPRGGGLVQAEDQRAVGDELQEVTANLGVQICENRRRSCIPRRDAHDSPHVIFRCASAMTLGGACNGPGWAVGALPLPVNPAGRQTAPTLEGVAQPLLLELLDVPCSTEYSAVWLVEPLTMYVQLNPLVELSDYFTFLCPLPPRGAGSVWCTYIRLATRISEDSRFNN